MANLPNLDTSNVAGLTAALATLTPADCESFFSELRRRFPHARIPWEQLLGGVGSALTAAVGGGPGSMPIAALFGTVPTALVCSKPDGVTPALVVLASGVSSPALSDVTSAVNTAQDPGILDVSPWSWLLITWFCSAGTSAVTVKQVDDAGTDWPGASLSAPAAAVSGLIVLGPGVGVFGTNVPQNTFAGPLPRRVHIVAGAAGVGNTVRLRIEGRR